MTDGDPPVDEPDEDDNLFGIDLGHRGDRADDTSRDEVPASPPPPRASARTLTDRLASAAADREEERLHPGTGEENDADDEPVD